MSKALRFYLIVCAGITLPALAEAQAVQKCVPISGIGASRSLAQKDFEEKTRAFAKSVQGKVTEKRNRDLTFDCMDYGSCSTTRMECFWCPPIICGG